MGYAAEIGAMKYISSFIKNGSVIIKCSVKVNGGGIHTHTQYGDSINLLSFFKIRKVG